MPSLGSNRSRIPYYPAAMDAPTAHLGDRSLFPQLRYSAYCNHAGVSPVSTPVAAAVGRALADFGREGLGAVFPWLDQREQLRARMTRLLGAREGEIAFTSSTTRGISDIALSLPWKDGERVLLFEGEFPTNVTPWQCAARAFKLELVWLPARAFDVGQQSDQAADGLERLEAELKRGLRLVAISAVQFQSGLRMPLREMGALCRRYGAELFVDAIQGLGIVPIDVEEMQIDYASSGAHKWLMGTEGTAVLYVRRERAAALVPRVAGWLSHEDADDFLRLGAGHLRYDRALRRDARLFEGSSQSVLGLAALDASVELLLALGVQRIFEHVQAYHDRLEPELVRRGFQSLRSPHAERRSGTASFLAPAQLDPVSLQRALVDAGIACGLPDGVLRFSPHWPNHLREIDDITRAVDAALGDPRLQKRRH